MKFLIQENAYENVICEMVGYFIQADCVNSLWLNDAIW